MKGSFHGVSDAHSCTPLPTGRTPQVCKFLLFSMYMVIYMILGALSQVSNGVCACVLIIFVLAVVTRSRISLSQLPKSP